jgi:hypothetical protein
MGKYVASRLTLSESTNTDRLALHFRIVVRKKARDLLGEYWPAALLSGDCPTSFA